MHYAGSKYKLSNTWTSYCHQSKRRSSFPSFKKSLNNYPYWTNDKSDLLNVHFNEYWRIHPRSLVPLPLLVKFRTAKFPVLSNYRNLFIRMEQTLIDFIRLNQFLLQNYNYPMTSFKYPASSREILIPLPKVILQFVLSSEQIERRNFSTFRESCFN